MVNHSATDGGHQVPLEIGKRHGQGIDREVPTCEIVREIAASQPRHAHDVNLAARKGPVSQRDAPDADPVVDLDGMRIERLRRGASPDCGLAGNDDVDLGDGSAEQGVAHGPADDIGGTGRPWLGAFSGRQDGCGVGRETHTWAAIRR